MWRQRGHFDMVFNVYDSKVIRGNSVKEKHMSPYIEYESPVYYMKALCLTVRKLCAELTFFKCISKVTVKVT